MRTKLLLQFADWLEQNIAPESFEFDRVITMFDKVNNCGTVCCAAGWLPLFDREVTKTNHIGWDNNNYSRGAGLTLGGSGNVHYSTAVSKFFNMNKVDADYLFAPDTQYKISGWSLDALSKDATPSQVADAIRHYVEIKS